VQNSNMPTLKPISEAILPHPRYDNKRVISWSDVIAIESGNYPQSFSPNRKMVFGTYIHKLIEEDKLPFKVPRGTHHEVKVKHGRLVGTIDSHDKITIIDFKTATKHWSRLKAESHEQQTYYAYLLWKDKGVQVKEYKIVSIETCWDDDELSLTGSVKVHTVPITMADMLKARARADRAILKLRRA